MNIRIFVTKNNGEIVAPYSKLGDALYRQIHAMLEKQDYEDGWVSRYAETLLRDAHGEAEGTFVCEVDGGECDAEPIAEDIEQKFEGRKRYSVSCEIVKR